VTTISKGDLKAALKSAGGIYAVAAEKLGCTRQNVSARIAADKELQEWIVDIEQTITDQAQANVVLALQERQPNGRPTKEALKQSNWWLDRLGKDRGFSTRSQLSNPDGSPVQFAAPTQVTINIEFVTPAAQMEDVVD
jgi:hypothetical protein